MRLCINCGAEVKETASFCTNCGASLKGEGQAGNAQKPSSELDSAISHTKDEPQHHIPAKQHYPISTYSSYENSTESFDLSYFISNLNKGNKVVGIGAILSLISFFMPIYSSGATGVNLGGSEWLKPLLSVLLLFSIYFFQQINIRQQALISAAQIALGMVYAPQFFVIFKGGEATVGLAVGYYFISLGFLISVVGGFLNLNELMQKITS